MKAKERKHFFLHVVIPILLGAVFYYLLCPGVVFVNRIDSVLGFGFHIRVTKLHPLICFIRYYMLDALWAYAMLHAVFLVLGNKVKALIASIILCSLMSVGSELAQLFQLAKGTFDIWDIFVEMLAIGLASLVIENSIRRKNNEKIG